METAAYIILVAVLIWSPLAFGAVHLQAQAAMSLGVFAASALLAVKSISTDRRSGARQIQLPATSLNLVFLLFLFYLAFQLIPLPEFVLRFLSPETLVVAQKSSPASQAVAGNWHALSAYSGPVRQSLILWITYGLFFFSLCRVLNTRKRIDAAVLAILLLGCFETLYGMSQAFTHHGYIWWIKKEMGSSEVSGTYVNRNHFAGLMAMITMLGVLYAAALSDKRKRRTEPFERKRHLRARFSDWISGEQRFNKMNFILFAAAVTGIGLIFSASRGGMISAAAGLLLTGVLLVLRQTHRRKGFIVLILFLVISGYALAIGVEKPLSRFDNFYTDWEARERYAERALLLFKDYRFTGAGIGLFQYAYPKYQAAQDTKLFIEFAHNDWAQFLAEAGIVGIVLLLGGIGYYLFHAVTVWRSRHDGFAVCLGILPFAALAAIAIHSWSDFNLHIPANFLMLAAVLAIGCTAVHMASPRRSQDNVPQDRLVPLKYRGAAFILLFACAIGWSGVWSVRHAVGEAVYYAFRSRDSSTPPAHSVALLQSAMAWDPTNGEYPYNLSLSLQHLRNAELIDPDKSEEERKPLQLRIIKAMEDAVGLNPLNSEAHVRLGWEYIYFWSDPDSYARWIQAADLSMERGGFFAGENNPYLHILMGDYWLMRSKTVSPASKSWEAMLAKARRHYQKNLELETGNDRKRMLEHIRSSVWVHYPDQQFLKRMLEQ